ncbi:conserved hypothetical protein [Ricinus communis]|uniref:AAA+ ATPase At3g28540-like C-terminal domain-containing protein n=2 Tax=Ricinus communis TaxID=3988 RepID=B9RUJ8_RICCO|nr:conserved hypothetical protein [Ricinus communis]
MTPADVAEHLMPKTLPGNAEVCLESLIVGLEKAKEVAKLKAEEEAKEKELSPPPPASAVMEEAKENNNNNPKPNKE